MIPSPDLPLPLSSLDDQQGDMGVASDAERRRAAFSLRKSSSDGSINRVIHHNNYPLPRDPSPAPTTPSSDKELGFRRVATIASPLISADQPEGNVAPPTETDKPSGPTHRPLRRSLTLDSPDPDIPGE